MAKKTPVTVGTNNVFADLGYDNPDEALTKAQLATQISEAIAAGSGVMSSQCVSLFTVCRHPQ